MSRRVASPLLYRPTTLVYENACLNFSFAYKAARTMLDNYRETSPGVSRVADFSIGSNSLEYEVLSTSMEKHALFAYCRRGGTRVKMSWKAEWMAK